MKKIVPVLMISALLLAGCGILAPAQTAAPVETAGEQFVFTKGNFPTIAVGASLAPLAEGAVSLLLGKDAGGESVLSGATDDAYRALMDGEADVVLASAPSEAMAREMEDAGFAFTAEPVALDALVFMVSADNPVSSLTSEQIRDIYSGKITNWSEVGGRNEDITAFQRSGASGSQTAMLDSVMEGAAMAQAPSMPVLDTMDVPAEALAAFDGSAGAIGYAFSYYAQNMGMAEGVKIISVDGIAPTGETIASGQYPFVITYCAAVADTAAEGSGERVLWEWLCSANGRKLLLGCGYVPVQ